MTITGVQKTPALRLSENKQELVACWQRGAESDFPLQHARILDAYFQEVFAESTVGLRMDLFKNPYAVIAMGGYGRSEQCVHSDVDLMLLFKRQVPQAAADLIQEFVYPLWDLGLDVSPATRSLKECLKLASQDFDILTPLLDARFICGMSPLYTDLMERLHGRLLPRCGRKLIDWLIERNVERHRRFGDSSYLLEPNLKEGQGGLRDYHTLLWIARIQSNLKVRRDLEYWGYLSHEEYISLNRALAFILDVRSRLHYLTGRRCDQLHIEYQPKLAAALKFKKAGGQMPVERFLGELHAHMGFLKQRLEIFLYELRHRGRKSKAAAGLQPPGTENIEVKRGMLRFVSSEKIIAAPRMLIRIFEESARSGLPLNPEAKRIIKDFSYLIDASFRRSPEVVRIFERILTIRQNTFSVLNEMLASGFLARFIPQMAGIINRIQYNEYHIYPVDRHLLQTVQVIKRFSSAETSPEPLAWRLYRELRSRKVLLWAALLHDIGKGLSSRRHAEHGAQTVRRILLEKGLGLKDVETVEFLVREHLLLMKTATRRDLGDEETALSCARRINNMERLKMLYLLTVADSMATGPKAWNDWNAMLLRDLFLKVLRILEKGELASRAAVASVGKKKEALLASAESPPVRQEMAVLFELMSPRYLLYADEKSIRGHAALYRRLRDNAFVWDIAEAERSDTRVVTLCAPDRPGLFAKIAGTFTLNQIDILNAQAFTWKNNTALDIFTIHPPRDRLFENRVWERAGRHLNDALSGKLDLAAEIQKRGFAVAPAKPAEHAVPPRVEVDNSTSSFFTLVEVFTYNFPGLLYKVADAIFQCGLDIRVAKIATEVDQVVDVFYVRDLFGQKLDAPDQVAALKATLLKVIA